MKKTAYLLISFLSLNLISCNSNNQNNELNTNAKNLTEALTKLTKFDNYTLDVTDSILGDTGKISITKNGYYNSLYDYGYVECDEGVYQVSFSTKEEGLASELILNNDGSKAKKIYDDEVATSFKDFDISLIDVDDDKTATIKNNRLRRTFLKIVDQDADSLLTDVSDFVVTLDGESVNDLLFLMSFKDGTSIILDVEDVNFTTNFELDYFLDNGGSYFTPSEDLIRIRNLFKNDNYTRNIYQIDQNENETLIGKEIFNPKYFATIYDCELNPENAFYLDAYFGANNNVMTVNYTNNKTEQGNLKGIYKTFITYNENNKEYEITPYLAKPYVDTLTSIPEALNYPKNLATFANYEYYEYDSSANEYYSDNLVLALSMYINFNLAPLFQDYNVELVGTSFSYDLKEEDKDCKVTFNLFLTLNGELVYQDFEFTNFNNSIFEPLEELTTTWTYNANHPLGN